MAMDRTAIRMRHESGARPGAPPLITACGRREDLPDGQARVPRRCAGSTSPIGAGEMVAVVGPSGQRQDDDPEHDHGHRPARPPARVTVDGRRLDAMSEEELAVWRGANVGIVFQFFQLLPTLSALENAVLPLDFARRGSKRERFERARHNLELVGLGDKARPPAGRALGRRAAAGRDRAGARLGPEARRRRRADRQPRHGHRGRDVRAARAAERRGQDGPLRHARSASSRRARIASSRSATAWSSPE